MKHLIILATLAALVAAPMAAPVAAQSLSILLPALTFPDPVAVPSTKGCAPSSATVCQLQK